MTKLYEPFPTGYNQGMWASPTQQATTGATGGDKSGLGLPRVGHPLQGLGNMVQALFAGHQNYLRNQQQTPKDVGSATSAILDQPPPVEGTSPPEISPSTPLPPPPGAAASGVAPPPPSGVPPTPAPPTRSISPAVSPSVSPMGSPGMQTPEFGKRFGIGNDYSLWSGAQPAFGLPNWFSDNQSTFAPVGTPSYMQQLFSQVPR